MREIEGQRAQGTEQATAAAVLNCWEEVFPWLKSQDIRGGVLIARARARRARDVQRQGAVSR